MIQYILECIAFQLVFLVIYDFFLKRETFFQWNRAYLISTYILSLVLPWIKIEAFKTSVSEPYFEYPEFWWGMNDQSVTATVMGNTPFHISLQEGILFAGMLLATLYFAYKLFQIYRLRKTGEITYYPKFTRIVVANSQLAFSFFRSIFLGDKIMEREHENIIRHELVHIEQRHSWDLLFFELMRIVGWFNPLVYVYQGRISELHEFIADAQVAKTDKNEQYQLLLSQTFQTENISFINQFFKSSLIKKRIVMLQKTKSKRIWQLKYLLLVPILIGMLLYTSSEAQNISVPAQHDSTAEDAALISEVKKEIDAKNLEVIDVPFAVVEEVPIFPGCENAEDKRECFQKSIQRHISANFKYPKEAREKGIQGRVSVLFTMDETGNITNIRQRGPDKVLEDEAVRIISLLPQMQPGKQRGKLVRVPYSIPINFRLNRDKANNENAIIAFENIEEAPIFPGCEGAADKRACFNEQMQKHISKNFKYPQEAQEKGIQGKVYTMFLIGADGEIKNLKMRSPDKLLEAEAERIIGLLPRMVPGKQKGEAVDIPYAIPIHFKLTGEPPQDSVIIRGTHNGPDPIYMMDGIEVPKERVVGMEPHSIESIYVLKGEAAIEKYGKKGENGVVEVITKKK